MNILRYWREQRGAAAIEFAIILSLLVVPMMSVVDVGVYTFSKIQVENAAQSAAQTLWATCTSASNWPFSNYCTQIQTGTSTTMSVSAAVTSAAQQTSLGSNVTVSSITDGYYCTAQKTATGVQSIVLVSSSGTFSSPLTSATTSCGSAPSGSTWSGGSSPGEYATVTVSYTYKPMFGGISVASLLTTPITKTATIRID